MTRQTDILALNNNLDTKDYTFVIGRATYRENLKYAPDGWDDEIVFERNKKYKGVFRRYSSNEVKFPKDGRELLKAIYEADGINADASLYVYKMNHTTYVNELHYSGKIDFSTYKIDELFVSVQIMDDSFSERFKNRANIETNLLQDTTIEGATMSTLPATGQKFTYPSNVVFKVSRYSATGYLLSEATETSTTVYKTLKMDLGFSQIDEAESQTEDSSDYFFRDALDANSIRLVLTISCQVRADTSGTYDLDFVIRNGVFVEHTYTGGTGLTANTWHDIDIELDVSNYINVTAGQDLTLEMRLQTGTWPASNDGFTLNVISSQFELQDPLLALAEVEVTGLQYYEALYQNLRKIMCTTNPFYSEYFGRTDTPGTTYASDGTLGAISKGQLIRGLDDDIDVNFSASFDDLFESLNAIYCLGAGYEQVGGVNKIRVENFEYFFDLNVVLDVSDRISEKQIGKEVLPDWHYAKIETGYAEFENELEGALFEYNGKQTFATVLESLASLNNKYDIVSKFRGDTVGMNILRNANGTADSEDVDGDDDTFVIDCVRVAAPENFQARTDEDFDLIFGSSETCNNYLLTPMRNMRRHGAIIRAGLERELNTYLTFQKADRQVGVITRLSTERANVEEQTDVRVNTLSVPYWFAEAYTVDDCPFYFEDIQDIEDNPRGLIKLADDKYGWIMEIKTSKDNKASMKLLRMNLNHHTPI